MPNTPFQQAPQIVLTLAILVVCLVELLFVASVDAFDVLFHLQKPFANVRNSQRNGDNLRRLLGGVCLNGYATTDVDTNSRATDCEDEDDPVLDGFGVVVVLFNPCTNLSFC
jgi:hypothetical protein